MQVQEQQSGGPAFPGRWHEDVGDGFLGGESPGMTLRDYFIAHAPAEPQPWFEPVMPNPCPVPPAPILDKTEEERHDSEGYMEDMLRVGDVRSNRLAAYFRERESWQLWKRAWDQDRSKQRWVQWPAAWADAMLEAREAA